MITDVNNNPNYENNRGAGYQGPMKIEVRRGADQPDNIEKNFKILRKCQSKLDCLIFEMLFIRLLKPKLNKQFV